MLELTLRPGVLALLAVVSVLHSRGAKVVSLQYAAHHDDASLVLHIRADADETDRLAAQIDRRISVTSISLRATTT